MRTADVVAGTEVFKSYDKDRKLDFFWYKLPSGETGGVVDRGGVPPTREEAIMVYPDNGKPFIGFRKLEPVLVY